MTPKQYVDAIHALGLTPAQPSYEGATLHQDREGHFHSIPDPDALADDEERQAMFDLKKMLLGITDH